MMLLPKNVATYVDSKDNRFKKKSFCFNSGFKFTCVCGCLFMYVKRPSPYGVCRCWDSSSLIWLKNVDSLHQLFCLFSNYVQPGTHLSLHWLHLCALPLRTWWTAAHCPSVRSGPLPSIARTGIVPLAIILINNDQIWGHILKLVNKPLSFNLGQYTPLVIVPKREWEEGGGQEKQFLCRSLWVKCL